MMPRFKEIRQDYFHRVSISPDQPLCTQLRHSDIVLHLPVLEYYASLCEHCTEFGVNEGHSTVALLSGCLKSGRGQLVSYDIARTPIVDVLENMDVPWKFHRVDTGDARFRIRETDLLFLDTLHTYDHLKAELTHSGRKAKKFLIFHDTYTCGEKDLSGNDPQAKGILPAIREYFEVGYPGQYRLIYESDWNNGLMVYERCPNSG